MEKNFRSISARLRPFYIKKSVVKTSEPLPHVKKVYSNIPMGFFLFLL